MEDIVKSYKNQVPGPFLLTEAILFSSSAEKIKAKYIFKTFFILVFQILNWLIIFFLRFVPSLQRAAPFCNTESNENQTSNKINISNIALK